MLLRLLRSAGYRKTFESLQPFQTVVSERQWYQIDQRSIFTPFGWRPLFDAFSDEFGVRMVEISECEPSSEDSKKR